MSNDIATIDLTKAGTEDSTPISWEEEIRPDGWVNVQTLGKNHVIRNTPEDRANLRKVLDYQAMTDDEKWAEHERRAAATRVSRPTIVHNGNVYDPDDPWGTDWVWHDLSTTERYLVVIEGVYLAPGGAALAGRELELARIRRRLELEGSLEQRVLQVAFESQREEELLSQRLLRARIPGRAENVDAARDQLIEWGLLVEAPGRNGGKSYLPVAETFEQVMDA